MLKANKCGNSFQVVEDSKKDINLYYCIVKILIYKDKIYKLTFYIISVCCPVLGHLPQIKVHLIIKEDNKT